MKEYKNLLIKDLEKLEKTTPFILGMTNIVTVNDVTNAILALKGSAAIIEEQTDVAFTLAQNAKSIYLNIGTYSDTQFAMAKKMIQNRYPDSNIIMDIVGCGATHHHLKMANALIPYCHVIRGNYAEIISLLNHKVMIEGVDSNIHLANPELIAQKTANKYQKIIAMSGKIDVICDQEETYLVDHGNAMLKQITGTGCILGGMIATVFAINPTLNGVMNAVLTLTLASEIAALEAKGPYSFRTNLFDEIFNLKNTLINNEFQLKISKTT